MDQRPIAALVFAVVAAAICGAAPPVARDSVSDTTAARMPRAGTVEPMSPFLFGCDWPIDGSQEVKKLFWETGCNYARITGGGYGWCIEGHKRALAELQEHGVKVMLQLGSHYPDGKYFALKDSYFVDQAGKTGTEDRNAWAITYNGSAWPQYSYASEPFRLALEKDFSVYLNAMKPYSNIAGLLLHNEPGYHWIDSRVFDYNPYAISRFRQWLPSQHATIRTLNDRWRTHFASFEQVDPPHDLPPVGNIAAWMDWRRFNIALIQEFLHWEREFARSVRPDLPCTTNLSGPLDNWFAIRLGDPYRLSTPFDIVGMDIYPAEWSSRSFPAFAMDMARGAAQGRPAQVIECDVYSAEKWGKLSSGQRAELLESTVWSYAGHGAKGILLWTLSGQQGFALTRGAYNPSVRSVRDIAHTAQMVRLGDFHKPAPGVALCVDQDAYVYYGGRRPKLEGGTAVGQAVDQLYTALASAHLECDVICDDQVRQGVAGRYRTLVLAAPVMMDSKLADRLAAFVKSGGTLVAEAPLAALDRWGRALPTAPGFGLDRVFGVGTARNEGRDGIAVTASRYGKGVAVLVGENPRPDPAGAPPDLPRSSMAVTAASMALKYGALVPIATTDARTAFLDCSILDDDRGNRLVVVANPPDHAHPLTVITGAFLSVAAPAPAGRVRAFAFVPTREKGGSVSSGPRPLSVTMTRDRWTAALPPVTSAMPVLFARDTGPLVALEAPAAAPPGAQLDVRVTCFNASPRPISGRLSLVLPSGWKADAAQVELPANGESLVVLRAHAGAQPGRAIVKARLDCPSGSVLGVPVDIVVEGANARSRSSSPTAPGGRRTARRTS